MRVAVSGGDLLAEVVQRHRTHRRRRTAPQRFDSTDGLRREQYIPADIANLCRHVVDDQDALALAHRMNNTTAFEYARAIRVTALHILDPALRSST